MTEKPASLNTRHRAPESMNSLIDWLEGELLARSGVMELIDALKLLERQGFLKEALSNKSRSLNQQGSSLELFQKNFIVKHALYRLRARWQDQEIAELIIGTTRFEVKPWIYSSFDEQNSQGQLQQQRQPNKKERLSTKDELSKMEKENVSSNLSPSFDKSAKADLLLCEDDEALQQYYLDWKNFESQSQASIDELLDDFWKTLKHYQPVDAEKGLQALAYFELSSKASERELKQVFRRRAQTLHPDRGGDDDAFIQLRLYFETALGYIRART